MPTPSSEIIDVRSVLARFQHSDELLCDLVDIFMDNGWKLLDEARQAVAASNLEAAAASAHALKGALSNLSATAATEAAAGLESAARRGDADVPSALRRLDDEMTRLRPALETLVAERRGGSGQSPRSGP